VKPTERLAVRWRRARADDAIPTIAEPEPHHGYVLVRRILVDRLDFGVDPGCLEQIPDRIVLHGGVPELNYWTSLAAVKPRN
jgi:hypothetical protein